ncbi:MAG: B12-binding domain-containing protein [Pirellulales bacterium]|nr:B12-binding domain-containing protein [Pirellulales bacterium]
MKRLVTPKQVAQAIGMSESSVKRWCDRGLLNTVRTAGGHRRLAIDEVVQFLRKSGHKLLQPELLGLPVNAGQGTFVVSRARDQMREALLAGDEEQCRRIVSDLYLSGQTACDLCDRVLAAAFHEIGHGWECGKVVVYRERRSCEIALKALHDLRLALRSPQVDAPMAIGGALEDDPYRLPTTMVEIALRETGWRATSLGTMLPTATLSEAVRENQPALLWVSVSTIASVPRFLDEYARLCETATALGTAVVVGGRALTEKIRRQMTYSAYCDTLRHLVTFVATLTHRLGQPETKESG